MTQRKVTTCLSDEYPQDPAFTYRPGKAFRSRASEIALRLSPRIKSLCDEYAVDLLRQANRFKPYEPCRDTRVLIAYTLLHTEGNG